MADSKSNGPRPSDGKSNTGCNASNTPQHMLLKMGKKTDLVAGGPKTPA